ncbi:MAG: hypothetical protein MUF13_12720 [Akkermansiaceae bacterium]|nr:hypothetical protein [Akkermansiaceae bacterium]
MRIRTTVLDHEGFLWGLGGASDIGQWRNRFQATVQGWFRACGFKCF